MLKKIRTLNDTLHRPPQAPRSRSGTGCIYLHSANSPAAQANVSGPR